MLFSEEWLRHYINPNLSSEELCETLTMGGLEVEGAEPIAPAFTGVVVAKILKVENHPNADKLHICEVDVGAAENLQIVCGAPNAAEGIKVPCAMEGAVLPGDFKIKKAKLRGVPSCGMLCSSRELGINEDHHGLMVLPEDAPIGENIRTYLRLDDKKIEVKLTPNRGDALSIIGVGRDLRAMTGADLAMPDFTPVAANCDAKNPITLAAEGLCGRFASRVIQGLNAKAPTPEWMKERLERSGQRSISALVDISNYVMLELGRPTHIFDFDKVEGPLTVRWSREGEEAELLNGQTVKLGADVGVIADDARIEALAGIMGGDHAAVSLDTKNIFIEAAFWHPTAIQGRCRKLNFSTDAAHRFERGVDFASNTEHLEYITRLILDICGTAETKIGPVVDQVFDLPRRDPVKMRLERCNKVIGIEIPADKVSDIFHHLGFDFSVEGSVFTVVPPSYRFDIEIEEDLIEEVARLYGYQNLPEKPPVASMAMMEQPEDKRNRHELRKRMAMLGFQELVNFSFVEREWETDFAGNADPITVLNPIASQMSVMRSQIIGNLVDILKFNLNRKADRVNVFELGRIFRRDASVKGSDSSVQGVFQPLHIAALSYGSAFPKQWGEKDRLVDFYDLKGKLEELIFPLKARFEVLQHPALHPGRSAKVIIGGEEVGFIGELHPKLLSKYGLVHAPIVFELAVEPLLNLSVPAARAVPKHQVVERDLSVLIDNKVPVQTLLDAVHKAQKKDPRLLILDSFELFDLYRPKDAEENARKSLAFTVKLQGLEDAVTDEQADNAIKALLEILEAQGAELRK
jgi:phenylalanyl-tRNA synthetase beta chain